MCVLPRSPGCRRGSSKVQNSKVAFIRSFRFGVRCRFCKGILRFRGAKCPKFSRVAPRAGAAMRLTAGAAGFLFNKCYTDSPEGLAEIRENRRKQLRTAVTLLAGERENPCSQYSSCYKCRKTRRLETRRFALSLFIASFHSFFFCLTRQHGRLRERIQDILIAHILRDTQPAPCDKHDRG